MRNLLLGVILVIFASCATRENPVKAFEPGISAAELNYVVLSLDRFLENGAPYEPESAKRTVLYVGRLRGAALNVELPDRSTLSVKIDGSGRVLISGKEFPDTRWLVIRREESGGYGLTVGPRSGAGGYAGFLLQSKSGRVSDRGTMIACALR